MTGDNGTEKEGASVAKLGQGESFSWGVRLSDKAPAKRWVVLIAAVAAALVGLFVFRSLLLAVLGFAIILGTTAEFWLGTRFKLDSEGASARTGVSATAIRWTEVKRVVIDESGIKLSPLEEAGRLAPFRGVYLRYGEEEPGRIETAVRDWITNDVRYVDGRADGGGDASPYRQGGGPDPEAEVRSTGDSGVGNA